MKKSFGGKIVVCSDLKMALNFQMAFNNINLKSNFIAINLVKKEDYRLHHVLKGVHELVCK